MRDCKDPLQIKYTTPTIDNDNPQIWINLKFCFKSKKPGKTTMLGTELCMIPRLVALVYCAAKMKKMVNPARKTPPIRASHEMFWLISGHSFLISRPQENNNIVKQRNHLSAIISIGETSPTDAGATIVWPPHIIAAINKANEGLVQKRRKSEDKNMVNLLCLQIATEARRASSLTILIVSHGLFGTYSWARFGLWARFWL